VGTRAVARVCLVPCAPKAALPLFHTLSASHALGRSSGLSQMRPTLVQTRGLAKRDRRERMAAAVASVKPVRRSMIRYPLYPGSARRDERHGSDAAANCPLDTHASYARSQLRVCSRAATGDVHVTQIDLPTKQWGTLLGQCYTTPAMA